MELTSLASVRQAANAILAMNTPLDVLIHNAGMASDTPQDTEDGIEQLFEIMLYAPFLLSRLLLPLLQQSQHGGRIVHVSSSLSLRAITMPSQVPVTAQEYLDRMPHPNSNQFPAGKEMELYAVVKRYQNRLTLAFQRHLSEDCKDTRVSVVSVCPGFIPTTQLTQHAPWLMRSVVLRVLSWTPITQTISEGVAQLVEAAQDRQHQAEMLRKHVWYPMEESQHDCDLVWHQCCSVTQVSLNLD